MMSRTPAQRKIASVMAGVLLTVVVSASGPFSSLAVAGRAPGSLDLDDLAKPLVEKEPRNEAEADRVQALAHFATARTLQQRGHYSMALQHYARAYRLDPSSSSLGGVVLLATQQRRLAMAARYAVKGVDAADVGSAVVRRVAAYLTDQLDLPHAIELYKKAIAAPLDEDDDPAMLIAMRMELARLCMASERYREAAEQFAEAQEAIEHPAKSHLTEEMRKALLNDPSITYLLFADAYLMADRLPEASAAFRAANERRPNAAQFEYNQARVELRSGHAKEALEHLDKAFADKAVADRLVHEAAGPYELLADILKKLGQQDKLIGRLESLKSRAPGDAFLSYFLAEQYAGKGQVEKAEKLFEPLLETNPSTSLFRRLAELYRQNKQYEKLLHLAGMAIAKVGTLEALEGEAKKLTADAALFQSLVDAGRLKLNAKPSTLTYGEGMALGMLSQEYKKHDLAGEFFQAAVDAAAKPMSGKGKSGKPVSDKAEAAEALVVWGVGLMVDERSAEAVDVFKRGLDPKLVRQPSAAIEFYLAGALAFCNRTDEALAAADKATTLSTEKGNEKADDKPTDAPTDSEADEAVAGSRGPSARFASRKPWILERAKRYQEARHAYEALVARYDSEPDNFEARTVMHDARLSLSALCVNLHEMPAAEEWLEEVLDEFPDDVGAQNDLGYLWADQNKHLNRALAMIQKAVAAEPANYAYRDSLGWIYFRLGRNDEAIAELKKAINDKEPDGSVLDHLAEVYKKTGQVEKARESWQKALAILSKEGDAEKIEEVKKKLNQTK